MSEKTMLQIDSTMIKMTKVEKKNSNLPEMAPKWLHMIRYGRKIQ